MSLIQLILAALAVYILVYLVVVLLSHTPRHPTAAEGRYLTTTAGGVSEPLEDTEGEFLSFSLVIPCFKETERLGIMLDEAVPLLEDKYPKGDYEIVLVDDGSHDGTAQCALQWAVDSKLRPGTMRVYQLEQNRGKGGAVSHGMRHVRGRTVLFADADGATKFSDFNRLLERLEGGYEVAIGSRAHLVSTEAVVKRSFIRNTLMRCLHLLVYMTGVRTIRDTQCGFKMFTREAAHKIFPYLHTERWIFDVEVLLIANKKGMRIAEVPVSWHEVQGSKIVIARDSIFMAIDLVVMRAAYMLGIYNEKKLTL
ncbi:dolichyl-phosphate beta-glucosyltransferase [Trichomonascus vanleenenianus]|uniref:dolichyl-phosphate beta-glucosyltransferase n=1 Tax=Trichomonascus vanleenenianus TaxID=2268995 RepID=UPI003EC9EE2D